MEFKLEYLIPVLGSAPPLLRWLVGLWLLLTLVVGSWTSVLYYSQNVRKVAVEQGRYQLSVQRVLDDFSGYLDSAVDLHQKEIDRIAQEMNYRNLYSSGPHLKAQYDRVKQTRDQIKSEWTNLSRRVEDLTMGAGHQQLVDQKLKQNLLEMESKKNATLLRIRRMTDEYFTSRNTFQKQQIEEVGKHILGD